MSYLIHFNPNHDPKNGRFTFSRKEQKANMKAIRKTGNYQDYLSEEYKNKFNNSTDKYLTVDDTIDIPVFRYGYNDIPAEDITELGIKQEIDSFLGKYSLIPYDEAKTIGQYITNEELRRLRQSVYDATHKRQEEWLEEVYPKVVKSLQNVDIIKTDDKIYELENKDADEFFKNNKRISVATDLAMKVKGKDWINKNLTEYSSWDGEKYAGQPSKLTFLQGSMNCPDYTRAGGLVQIADLAIQGYTKDQIIDIVDSANLMSDEFESRVKDVKGLPDVQTMQDISEYTGRSRGDFIDACIKEVKKGKSK